MRSEYSGVIPSVASNLSTFAVALFIIAAVASGFAQKKQPPAKPLDLNTATVDQLQQLPGVGPVTAKSIVDFRKKSGPFRRTSDLLAVRGISEGRFKQIQPYVVVTPSKPAAPTKTAPPTLPKPAPTAPPKAPTQAR